MESARLASWLAFLGGVVMAWFAFLGVSSLGIPGEKVDKKPCCTTCLYFRGLQFLVRVWPRQAMPSRKDWCTGGLAFLDGRRVGMAHSGRTVMFVIERTFCDNPSGHVSRVAKHCSIFTGV